MKKKLMLSLCACYAFVGYVTCHINTCHFPLHAHVSEEYILESNQWDVVTNGIYYFFSDAAAKFM